MQFSILATLLPALALAAPIVTPRAGTVIPGKYIVKFKEADFTTSAIDNAIGKLSKAPQHTYSIGNWKGFAAEMNDDVLKVIQAMPNVSKTHS
jgi:hypothetical protein